MSSDPANWAREPTCQISAEASGQKDHSHADSRARKTENATASATRTPIYNPAGKLAHLINEFMDKQYIGAQAWTANDFETLLRENWFELQAYTHAIHNTQKERDYAQQAK